MFVTVNGAKLYFDVESAGLVPDGPRMREKPTLLLLHGGPGFDHSVFKPEFARHLGDIAQVVMLDHRGNGRSSCDKPETWNLAQWGDDVKGFCDVLGIEKPIVYGVSFGGFVAQAYATRHPEHPAKLILTTTAAKMDLPVVFDAFERIGGKDARAVAETWWLTPSAKARAKYIEVCHPLYRTSRTLDMDGYKRSIIRNEVSLHFNGPTKEQGRMDFRADLAKIRCPTLVMAGDRDPITPMHFSEEIVRCLPKPLVRFERFECCGHGVVPDQPEAAFRVLREFIGAKSSGVVGRISGA